MFHLTKDGFAVPNDEEEVIQTCLSEYHRSRKRSEVLDLFLLYDKITLYALC